MGSTRTPGGRQLSVPEEEGVGHVGQLLGVLVLEVQGRGLLVRDDVVHEGRAGGAGVAEPHGLDGGGAEGEDLVAGALGIAVHVDEDVDPVGVDAVGRLAVAGYGGEVDEVLGVAADLLPERGVVVGGEGVAEDLDLKL